MFKRLPIDTWVFCVGTWLVADIHEIDAEPSARILIRQGPIILQVRRVSSAWGAL